MPSMARWLTTCAVVVGLAVSATGLPAIQAQSAPLWLPLEVVTRAASIKRPDAKRSLDQLAEQWRPGYAPMLLDLAEFSRAGAYVPGGELAMPSIVGGWSGPANAPFGGLGDTSVQGGPRPVTPVRERLLRFLERTTGQRFGVDLNKWHQWLWAQSYDAHPEFMPFKSRLYADIDSRLADFFAPGTETSIRLDEIEWGGVVVNGNPPLVYPKTIPAAEARYLRDNHIVFGIEINGRARAYPRRILAWHELARDRVGGDELTVVYCTLCGTAVPYDSVAGGRLHVFGTSGLLYRSNQLLFDEETKSLWSTLDGRPVVGPLVGSGAVLTSRAVVTATWGEWRRRHPQTDVLSPDTGHDRDYSEKVGYRGYFAADLLKSSLPAIDTRLSKKAEVLVMQLPLDGGLSQPVAIAAKFLEWRPLYQTRIADRDVVIVTNRAGANRAYDASGPKFVRRLADDRLLDEQNVTWQVTEDALVAVAERLPPRPRIVTERAFWFGWQAHFPDTILIK
jgi:hypothetical protein